MKPLIVQVTMMLLCISSVAVGAEPPNILLITSEDHSPDIGSYGDETVPTPHLDGKHTVFGAIEGAEDQAVVDSIAGGDKIIEVVVDGDSDALLAAVSDRVAEWNDVLDKEYPRSR